MSRQIEPQVARPAEVAGIAWHSAPAAQATSQRCVAVPFTSPSLCCLRTRAATQGGLEMLLSNPSGGRGIYVFGWPSLRAAAKPSVHDILLVDALGKRCSAAAPPTPARIRAASLEVAAAGHLGRRGALLARHLERSESLLHRRLRAHLLLELARALQIPEALSDVNDPWRVFPEEGAGWLAEAPRLLAACWRRHDAERTLQPQELEAATRELAGLALPLGLGPHANQARLPRLLRLAEERLQRWQLPGQAEGPAGERLSQAAAALQRAVALLLDPVQLLESWRNDRAGLIARLEQPEWLLDGWDRFCMLGRDVAGTSAVIQLLLYEGDNRSLRRADLDMSGLDGTMRQMLTPDGLAAGEKLRLSELELQLGEPEDLDA